MKTPEQWLDELPMGDDVAKTEVMDYIRSIQADALRHAANIARLTPTCGGGGQRVARHIEAIVRTVEPPPQLQ